MLLLVTVKQELQFRVKGSRRSIYLTPEHLPIFSVLGVAITGLFLSDITDGTREH